METNMAIKSRSHSYHMLDIQTLWEWATSVKVCSSWSMIWSFQLRNVLTHGYIKWLQDFFVALSWELIDDLDHVDRLPMDTFSWSPSLLSISTPMTSWLPSRSQSVDRSTSMSTSWLLTPSMPLFQWAYRQAISLSIYVVSVRPPSLMASLNSSRYVWLQHVQCGNLRFCMLE